MFVLFFFLAFFPSLHEQPNSPTKESRVVSHPAHTAAVWYDSYRSPEKSEVRRNSSQLTNEFPKNKSLTCGRLIPVQSK